MSSPDRPLLRSFAMAALLLVAATLLAYSRVPGCGFLWDDDDYVLGNPVLRTWGGLWRIWCEPLSLPQYYPLVHTTFWLEYRLWGVEPAGYHVVNVLLHAASAVVAWRLLVRLQVPGALLAALWFAVHPVQVESVAWITERKNVLSMLLALLAAHAWLRWHDAGRRRDLWLAWLAFAGALLSKTVTCSLPAALLVVTWWRRGRIDARAWRAAAPMLVLGAVLAWVTAHLESTHVGAGGASWQPAGAERLLLAGRALWHYAQTLVWPVGLCFSPPRWHLDTGSGAQWVFPIAWLLLLAAAWALRGRCGRGPLAALLVYTGVLVPALGFFDVFPFRYSWVADHFQYHATLAAFAGIAALAATAVRGWRGPQAVPKAAAGAVVAVLAVLTWAQTAAYRDRESLWRATLAVNPDSTLALVNLAGLELERGDAAAARPRLERALALDPGSYEAEAQLGLLAHQAGDRAAARRHYEAALRIKPDCVPAMNDFAVLLTETGAALAGLELVERALVRKPDYYDGHVTQVMALHALQRHDAALAAAEWVLQRTPQAWETRLRVADCLLAKGQFALAGGHAAALLQQRAGDARAQALFARALAHVVADEPPAAVVAKVRAGCTNARLEPAPLLPLVAAELRALGRTPQADAVAAAVPGR